MNSLTSILGLALPVLVTGMFALYFKLNQSVFKLVLAFGAAYLFSTTMMHLLPEAYGYDGSNVVQVNFKAIGLFIVIGFSAQLLIENLSAGVEHGHHHHHTEVCHKHFPYGIIIGLLIHSFLEGLPVYNDGRNDNFQLVLGLGIHNIPISFLFVALLKDHNVKAPLVLFFLFLFSMMAPLGYLFSFAVYKLQFMQILSYQYAAHAIVIGIFLFISTAILFETSDEHKYSPSKIASMLLGIILAFILS
jgi:zinc and cadmium transporter